jgi:hypothetical protein
MPPMTITVVLIVLVVIVTVGIAGILIDNAEERVEHSDLVAQQGGSRRSKDYI